MENDILLIQMDMKELIFGLEITESGIIQIKAVKWLKIDGSGIDGECQCFNSTGAWIKQNIFVFLGHRNNPMPLFYA